MSVTTAADEARDSAVDYINAAIKELSKIIVERCWGHDDFNAEYRAKMQSAFLTLLTVRDAL